MFWIVTPDGLYLFEPRWIDIAAFRTNQMIHRSHNLDQGVNNVMPIFVMGSVKLSLAAWKQYCNCSWCSLCHYFTSLDFCLQISCIPSIKAAFFIRISSESSWSMRKIATFSSVLGYIVFIKLKATREGYIRNICHYRQVGTLLVSPPANIFCSLLNMLIRSVFGRSTDSSDCSASQLRLWEYEPAPVVAPWMSIASLQPLFTWTMR